jgi:hypothetical protein
MDHKHAWKRSARKHGHPGRLFVQCTDPACRLIRQATISEGHLHVFHTGSKVGEKSRVTSYRLKKWQEKILAKRRETFVEFVDRAFRSAQVGDWYDDSDPRLADIRKDS